MDEELNVLALVKGGHRYIFIFSDEHRLDTVRTFGRFAADDDLNFSWYDATILSKRVAELPNKAPINRIAPNDQ